ncbi:hypothetical protein [Bathymodiolus japonicus methanotrophic gill symbiont]|uniref:hypothetical protein n=1 Tax=Bathymodiolus japonicus methanotrophic gill symbiont TaxID=113269 RepID=UPI001C8E4B5A|nr:hypothetical protein [Bathymodiolus japonicus methanotrophic gill symbiont]
MERTSRGFGMCWSGEASAVLAVAGLGTAAYIAVKGESKELWIPLIYFALMASVFPLKEEVPKQSSL